MGKVIYLTGAPAAGKSSTCRLLIDRQPEIRVWEYGAKLTEFVRNRGASIANQSDLRTQSAAAVTAQDVEEVDNKLIEFVDRMRGSSNIIIDSHAVTKEAFGYRVVPFSLERFGRLGPDEIWMLYTDPKVAIDRISRDPGGRPEISEEQARMHTFVQASVASTYAMSLGIPLYLFDSSGPQSALVDRLAERLQ